MAGGSKQSILLKLLRFIGSVTPGILAGMLFWALFLCAANALAAEISIPRAAQPHKAVLIRAAHAEFGLDAPVALLAAQVHQESLWRADAISSAGAQGLAQFMPSTARWLPEVAPHTGEPLPFNPGWSLRAMCAYDNWIFKQMKADSGFDRWAMTLSGYNGGPGWVRRDQRKAQEQNYPPGRWFDSVELVNAGRSQAAFKENRGYPRRILLTLMPVYERAGWGCGVQCAAGAEK